MKVRGQVWQEVPEAGDFLLHRGLGCDTREYPEVNERGEATFAEQARMHYGRVPGLERLRAVPADDPWYDCPPGPPLLPAADTRGWRASRAREPGSATRAGG